MKLKNYGLGQGAKASKSSIQLKWLFCYGLHQVSLSFSNFQAQQGWKVGCRKWPELRGWQMMK